MSVSNPRTPPPPAAARPAPANEWGVYDPSVAGIRALFARLGADDDEDEAPPPRRTRRSRPAPSSRRAATSETSGVGLAIAEAIARAQQRPTPQPARTITSSVAGEAAAGAVAVTRPATRRAPTAMWVRAVSVAPALDPVRDDVLGIFADLRIPAPVALVQYARGARIGAIRIIEP